MPPRAPKTNPKAEGQARKADKAAAGKAKEQAKVAAVEDAEWSKGAKGKNPKEEKLAKEEAARERKAEAARLLALEEASQPSKVKSAPVAKGASSSKSAPAKKADPLPKAVKAIPSFADGVEDSESFGATGIDDALDMLKLVSEKTDKASMGSRAAQTVELHPERRYKAAFEQYKEDMLPEMKKDYPGLRLQQYNDRLHKAFEKSPLNPFNQVTLGYDASKEDKVNALKAVREQTAARFAPISLPLLSYSLSNSIFPVSGFATTKAFHSRLLFHTHSNHSHFLFLFFTPHPRIAIFFRTAMMIPTSILLTAHL
ncbi:hypothetical protein P7C70_g9047, partial [Phenoliferia sp. Uapishka_3]